MICMISLTGRVSGLGKSITLEEEQVYYTPDRGVMFMVTDGEVKLVIDSDDTPVLIASGDGCRRRLGSIDEDTGYQKVESSW